MKTRIVQKAVLLNSDEEILLVRRSKTDIRRPLQWDFPGGIVEKGETLEDSIKREVQEETAIKAESLSPFFSKTENRNWKDDNGDYIENVVFIFYTGKIPRSEPKLSFEHDKYLWTDLKDAAAKIHYPLHKEVLDHLRKVQR